MASDDNEEEAIPPPPATKRLLCVRHGISVANERMSQPGNTWGEPTFRDDGEPDAPLSDKGKRDTVAYLAEQFRDDAGLREELGRVELVLVSPLTRCLQTYSCGVAPVLQRKEEGPPVVATPLLRERVYTASDTGRSAGVLREEFPGIDFSDFTADADCWWYKGSDDDDQAEEWRPHDAGQYYAVPGEPKTVFEERMRELDSFLAGRPETTILLVAHWGVLRHLTNGTEWKNAEAKILEHTFCPVRRTSIVKHV